MKVTMKTHEQLLASGWRLDESGDYTRGANDNNVIREMFELLGEEIEVEEYGLSKNAKWKVVGSRWRITPAMVVSKEEKVLEILRNYENHKTRTTPKNQGDH